MKVNLRPGHYSKRWQIKCDRGSNNLSTNNENPFSQLILRHNDPNHEKPRIK